MGPIHNIHKIHYKTTTCNAKILQSENTHGGEGTGRGLRGMHPNVSASCSSGRRREGK
jgi:hypothetical protein